MDTLATLIAISLFAWIARSLERIARANEQIAHDSRLRTGLVLDELTTPLKIGARMRARISKN